MRYIRTKDGRILSLNEFKYEKEYHWYRPNEKYLSRLNIGYSYCHWCFDDEFDLIPEILGKITVEKIKREECRFADKIEDLCDWFVDYHKSFDSRSIFKGKAPIRKYGHEIYGAIWTDKGLTYVAKINEKGEFELLKAVAEVGNDDEFNKRLDIIEKELKALEIIKELPKEEKQTLLNTIYTCTKDDEKYDLLDEVLEK